MDTWESRMAERARTRPVPAPEPEPPDTRPGTMYFEGTCDVCGLVIGLSWNWADGIIDYGYDRDMRMFTWIRHYATAPKGANPDCAVYSSRVYKVR